MRLSSGRFVTSVRDDTWVTVVMHQVVTTVVSMAMWQEIVKIAIIVGSLVILLKIVMNKKRLSRSRVMPECTL